MIKEAERKFSEFLRQKKLKLTPQRQTILREAYKAKRHFTADELLDISKTHDATISKATLYRTLVLLTEGGLLDEQDFGSGRKTYEKSLGSEHHDHLICVKCNRIEEFHNEAIEKEQEVEARKKNFKLLSHSHRLFGLCGRCK